MYACVFLCCVVLLANIIMVIQIKNVEMDGTCSVHGIDENSFQFLVGKPEAKITLRETKAWMRG